MSAAGSHKDGSTSSSTALTMTTTTIKTSTSGPQKYNIRGVSVDFPYPAYECQQVYMEKVIQSVQLSQHALLESPTGTGKTLCLLCAALAWRQSFVAATDLAQCPPSALQASLAAQLNLAAYGHEAIAAIANNTAANSNTRTALTNGGAAASSSSAVNKSSAAVASSDNTYNFATVDGLRGLYGLDRDVRIGGDVSGSSASGMLATANHASQSQINGSSASSQLTPLFSSIGSSSLPAKPKIIYSSRTHSQLAKVASELKQTIYRPKLTILGSRQQLCVHPVVSKLEGAAQNHACRSLTSEKQCSHYEHLPTWTSENQHLQNQVLDIEDLITLGKEQNMCPYFYSRDRMADAELVLLPYNYLIDPTIRSRLGLRYDNSILIFDEAHNLEGVCGDSASFDLSAADIAMCIQEIQKCIDLIRDPVMSSFIMEGSSMPGGNDIPDLQSLAILKTIMLEFESILDKQVLPVSVKNGGGGGGGGSNNNGKDTSTTENEGLTKPGSYIFQLLSLCKIQYENKDMLLELVDKSVNLLFVEKNGGASGGGAAGGGKAGGGGSETRKNCALDKFANCIKIIFKGSKEYCEQVSTYYRVHIHEKEPAKQLTNKQFSFNDNSSFNQPKQKPDVGRILSYWCFNPGIAMQDLTQVGIRCMLLTSGTLSPMESFAYELKLPFPIRLENPHVIQSEQIWVGILEKGPMNSVLNSGWKSREKEEYVNDLGNSIVNFSRIVPDGLLVFFPSYFALTSCHQAWSRAPGGGKPSIIERIVKNKALVIEPRTSSEFSSAISDFEQKLDDPAYNGACFFAVCRGKVSEGLDFADRAGRAVIVTGLPYPAFKDARVRLKRQYLDEAPKIPGIKQLTGMEWYGQQAARAINQAIGRVIRHRGDYGAIILADQRFSQSGVRAQLSRWIRPYVQTPGNFGVFTAGMQKFFKHAQDAYPEKERKPKESGKRLDDDRSSSSAVRQAEALQRANKSWSVSAITTPSYAASSAPTLKTSVVKQSEKEWNESYQILTEGLDGDGKEDVEMKHVAPLQSNPTLIKKHPTSLLMSLLKPASTTTQMHTTNSRAASSSFPSSSSSSSASTAAAAASSSVATTSNPALNRILRMTSLKASQTSGSSAAPMVKVEVEVEKKSNPAATPLQQSSFSDYLVKSTSTPLASTTKPSASSIIKDMIARVKQNLTQENFNQFKMTLQKLSTLKNATTTQDNFFQHVAAINSTVQLMASLLFGFSKNVVPDEDGGASTASQATQSAPLDSSLALSFESHIPAKFQTQYSKAVQAIMMKYPGTVVAGVATTAAVTTTGGSNGVKKEVKQQQQQQQLQRSQSSQPSSFSSSSTFKLELKREYSSLTTSSSSSTAAAASLPPQTTQKEFVAHVKAKLSQSNYELFKTVIIALEGVQVSTVTSTSSSSIPPDLLSLFQRLNQVLQSPPLMRTYASLIPQRLRPYFTAYLDTISTVAKLKWTQQQSQDAIEIDEDEDGHGEGSEAKKDEADGGQQSKKRQKLTDSRVVPPMFRAKTIVHPQ